MIHELQDISFFASFIQVLKIVNPDIQCGSQPGMAVRLPQVIKMLKQEVDYHLPPEKEIRRQVNNGYGVSPATQFFLRHDCTDTAIKRSKKNCKAERCVLIHLRAIDKQHREIILQAAGISKETIDSIALPESTTATPDIDAIAQKTICDTQNQSSVTPTVQEPSFPAELVLPPQKVLTTATQDINEIAQKTNCDTEKQLRIAPTLQQQSQPELIVPPQEDLTTATQDINEIAQKKCDIEKQLCVTPTVQQQSQPELNFVPPHEDLTTATPLDENAKETCDTEKQLSVTPTVQDQSLQESIIPPLEVLTITREILNECDKLSPTSMESSRPAADKTSQEQQETVYSTPDAMMENMFPVVVEEQTNEMCNSPDKKKVRTSTRELRRKTKKKLSYNNAEKEQTLCGCGCGVHYEEEGNSAQLWIECHKCKLWWQASCVPLTKQQQKQYLARKRKLFRCTKCDS